MREKGSFALRAYMPALLWLLLSPLVGAMQTSAFAQESMPPLLKAFIQSWRPQVPPLPQPEGNVIRVASVPELFQAVQQAQPGTTILLAAGIYELPRRLEIRTSRLTVRGAGGRPERVILDGGRHQLGELLAITDGATDVIIADLTLQNVRWNGLKLDTDTGVQRIHVYHCLFHNIWQRAIKGVRVPRERLEEWRPRDSQIRFCLFYNDRAKTYADDPADRPDNFNGNYIGGIDLMFPEGWLIADNIFYGLQGRTREGRGAIFLWHDARRCLVERNIILECDVGIALGNSYKPADIALHCVDVIVRNNFIVRCPESGIVAAYTRDCRLLHNTIHDPQNRLGRLIRLVHDNEGLLVANNLLSGPPIRVESTSPMTLRANLVVADYSRAFADATCGDLRLTAQAVEAIDHAEPLPDMREDILGRPRDEKPDFGAHEFRP